MGVISIYHPDVEEFITCKSNTTDSNTLERFNLSVMVDDQFMRAVQDDEEITLHYPVYDEELNILDDESKWQQQRKIRARELWDKIIERAYMSGEPGVLFYDTMNKGNNTYYCETIVATNPCG